MYFSDKINSFTASHPNKVAALTPKESITYKELEEKINQTANAFKRLGVQPGERILIQIGNRLEFMYCYFAAMKMGAIIVPINPLYTADEISYIASHSEPSLYICETVSEGNIETVKKQSPVFIGAYVLDEEQEDESFDHLVKNESTSFEQHPVQGDDVCQILYISGTTGKPKGAMLTHQGLFTNAKMKMYKETVQATEDDVTHIVAPLYHASSQTNLMNMMIISGGTSYLLEKFKPQVVLDTMVNNKITIFFGPPTMYTLLLNKTDIANYKLDLRIAITGAAPMSVEVHNQWKELFGFEILEGYGLTENSPVVSNHRPDGVKKIGSVGPPMDGITVKFVDEEGNTVPTGEVGELLVKGPTVMKGYWRQPEETAKVIKDGWLRTGDIGYKDEDGYLYIVDRKKDMINRGGMKIFPREVEEVLYKHPKILEVSVVGVPDEVMGEETKAFYTLKDPNDPVDEKELKEFCKQYLAPYKVPRKYQVMDELPKTISGKIQKTKLR